MFAPSQNFKILRRVAGHSDALKSYLVDEYLRRRKSIDPLTDKPRADVVNPNDGWVDTDLPRDEWASTEIVQTTVQIALGDPYGRLVPDPANPRKPLQFKDISSADKARRGASISFTPQVEVETEDEPEEAGDGDNLAGVAGRTRDNTPK